MGQAGSDARKKGTVLTKRQKDIAFRGGLRFAYDGIQNFDKEREGVILDVVAQHFISG